jgi:hypothetical protein
LEQGAARMAALKPPQGDKPHKTGSYRRQDLFQEISGFRQGDRNVLDFVTAETTYDVIETAPRGRRQTKMRGDEKEQELFLMEEARVVSFV